MKLNYHQTKFLLSAPSVKFLNEDIGAEIVFVGRSNAGKSSALNALTGQKNLAKISKTPGRTQMLNIFEVKENYRIVDVPGYGFASVPEGVKRQWQKALNDYFATRKSIIGLVILMDIRHPLQKLDLQMLELAIASNLQILLLLTKADKLSKSQIIQSTKLVTNKVKNLYSENEITVLPFSATKKMGVLELSANLDSWFKNSDCQ